MPNDPIPDAIIPVAGPEAMSVIDAEISSAPHAEAAEQSDPQPETTEYEHRPAPIAHAVSAFGRTLVLDVPNDHFLVDDSEWRLKNIYQPFLATQSLPPTGVAIDIGAGYGCFSILFAAAYPGWKIWSFEPHPEFFAALERNIAQSKLTNIVAVNLAVSPHNKENTLNIGAALLAGDLKTVMDLALPGQFMQHNVKRGSIEACATENLSPDFLPIEFQTFPTGALASLSPTFLKLIAPRMEQQVLEDLMDLPLDYLVGETWAHISSSVVFSTSKGKRITYLPVAGQPIKLRRTTQFHNRTPTLDVVVAMYNTRAFILECVDGIVGNDSADIRAVVIDDGSTDGCGDIVREAYEGNPRVVVYRKLNGGCASARNYGRLLSKSSHIAFVDADDVIDRQMFPKLLELARYTGGEVVQAGFDYLHVAGSEKVLKPSYENEAFAGHIRRPFADTTTYTIASHELMIGQPTIWRRVYRRDFLDTRKIIFPEHIRAFDDQIFQMLTLFYAKEIHAVDDARYHYRQHPGQDINQGDERFFYSLEMFRLVVKRGLLEGWNEFTPILRSLVNTINWAYSSLRFNLRSPFLTAAAELWVYLQKSLGPTAFGNELEANIEPVDFIFYVRLYQEKLKDFPRSYQWIYLDSLSMHVQLIKSEGV